ncbi:MAG TPA: hypothetical protein VIN08_25890 [Ohtaekwangia sp.]|uniref:hypothetical protein n=1 Tax=Ohtaekwangia sp. TaxID=2066019 RepID=UPI002F95E876
MNRNVILLFLLLSLLACSSDDLSLKESGAIQKACERCQKNANDMKWLKEKIQDSQRSDYWKGNFYIVSTNEGEVIVHQPMVMSCFGCLRFDCNGNTAVLSDAAIETVMHNINDGNLLYKAF